MKPLARQRDPRSASRRRDPRSAFRLRDRRSAFRRRHEVRDRGSVAVELAVLTPALLALLTLAIVAGRYELAAGTLEAASAAAARAASLARTPTAAEQAARAEATAAADGEGLHCGDLTVSVDTSGFRAARATPTAPAQVAVTLTCRLDLARLSLPGIPGSRTVTSRATSVLDTYRAAP